MNSSLPGTGVRSGGRRGAVLPTAVGTAFAGGLHLALAAAHVDGSAHRSLLHAGFFAVAGLAQLSGAACLVLSGQERIRAVVLGLDAALIAGLLVLFGAGDAAHGFGPPAALVAAAEAVAVVALLGARQSVRIVKARGVSIVGLVALTAFAGAGVALAPDDRHAEGTQHRDDDHRHGHDVVSHGLGGDPFDPGPPGRPTGAPVEGTVARIGGAPSAVVALGDVVWVAQRDAGTVRGFDALTGEAVTEPVEVGTHPAAIAATAGTLWIATAGDGRVVRIDARSGLVLGATAVGPLPSALAVGEGRVWVANAADGTVTGLDMATGGVSVTSSRRIRGFDPASGRTDGTQSRIGYGPVALEVAFGRVWVVNALDREIVSLDPRSGRLVGTPIRVAGGASDVVAHQGRLWVAESSGGTVAEIDPERRTTTRRILVDETAQPGQGPAALVPAEGRLLVVNNHDRTVHAVTLADGRVGTPVWFGDGVGTFPQPSDAVISGGRLHIASYEEGTLVGLEVG
ncbi:MAG TPA: PQQ-binding-like beta-propeller repeat protein [Acidimicrobiia bacterium]|nr:PQQ-binding-like beta-propeller repeat protein [Acidimicrobiia bacterium]